MLDLPEIPKIIPNNFAVPAPRLNKAWSDLAVVQIAFLVWQHTVDPEAKRPGPIGPTGPMENDPSRHHGFQYLSILKCSKLDMGVPL